MAWSFDQELIGNTTDVYAKVSLKKVSNNWKRDGGGLREEVRCYSCVERGNITFSIMASLIQVLEWLYRLVMGNW